MEITKDLATLHKDISGELLDTIQLLNILSDYIDTSKEGTVLDMAKKNVLSAFEKVNDCRRIIYICD